MGNLALLAFGMSSMWFVFPLAAVISLVYSSTRFELTEVVVRRAVKYFFNIVIFMAVVLLILVMATP